MGEEEVAGIAGQLQGTSEMRNALRKRIAEVKGMIMESMRSLDEEEHEGPLPAATEGEFWESSRDSIPRIFLADVWPG